MNRLIIGLVGPSGSGKTLACRHLIERHGFVRIHVAQAVKDALRYGFHLSDTHVDGSLIEVPLDELGGISCRTVLEQIGAAISKCAPEATAIDWTRRIKGLDPSVTRVLADGIRRPAEAAAVRRHGGAVIRIARSTVANGRDELPMDVNQRGIDADLTITNDGKPESLYAEMDRVLTYISAVDD